jgi:hypothetical protein
MNKIFFPLAVMLFLQNSACSYWTELRRTGGNSGRPFSGAFHNGSLSVDLGDNQTCTTEPGGRHGKGRLITLKCSQGRTRLADAIVELEPGSVEPGGMSDGLGRGIFKFGEQWHLFEFGR